MLATDSFGGMRLLLLFWSFFLLLFFREFDLELRNLSFAERRGLIFLGSFVVILISFLFFFWVVEFFDNVLLVMLEGRFNSLLRFDFSEGFLADLAIVPSLIRLDSTNLLCLSACKRLFL